MMREHGSGQRGAARGRGGESKGGVVTFSGSALVTGEGENISAADLFN